MTSTVSELNDIHPLDCLVVAQVRLEFADCTWFYDHRYIRYNDGTSLMLREHQRVAMVAYGVPDDGRWHVHHIDRNRVNNRADNLAVLSATEHSRLHASHPKSDRIVVTCPICETPFETTAYRLEQRNKTFCSEKCLRLASRKAERPSRERLADLLCEVGNMCELGRMFGVSDNAVRKWAKTYGII